MKFNTRFKLNERSWLLLITIALLIMISYLIFPLLDGLVLGVVFAYVGRPIMRLFGKRRKLGSLAGTLCIVVPLFLIFAIGASEAVNQVAWLETHQHVIIRAILEFISGLPISQLMLSELSGSLRNIIEIAAPFIAGLPFINLSRALSLGIINFLISLPVCYFLLLDGEKLVDAMMMLLLPEKAQFHRRYLVRIDSILSGIYLGSIYTAIAGGITSVAIFYLFGVPRPFAMACIVFLAGLVPFLTWLVFIPTAISRYVVFGPVDALLFFLAGSVLVHVAELVIRPYIVYAKSSLHPLLVLLTFLGGGLVAGIAGFFIAPAMVAMLMGMYEAVREDRINNIGCNSSNMKGPKAAETES